MKKNRLYQQNILFHCNFVIDYEIDNQEKKTEKPTMEKYSP